MSNGSKPHVPKGQISTSLNMVLYKDHAHLRNDKTNHLGPIRNYVADYGRLVKPRPTKPTPEIGSSADLQAYRNQMAELRQQIAGVRHRISRLDAKPGKRSTLKKIASSVGNTSAAVIKVGLLSSAKNKPDLDAAMQVPNRENAAKRNRRYTSAILLGEEKIKERKADSILRNAEHLVAWAKEQHTNGPEARKTEFATRLELLQTRLDELNEAIGNLDTAKKNLEGAKKDLEALQAEKKTSIDTLNKQLDDVTSELEQLPGDIAQIRQESENLQKEIKELVQALQEADDQLWLRLSVQIDEHGVDLPDGQNDFEESRQVQKLDQQIEAKKKTLETNTTKINERQHKLAQTQQQQTEIEDQIDEAQNDEAAQQIAQAMGQVTHLEEQYQASLADLGKLLDDRNDEGYQQTVKKRIEELRGEQENEAADPDEELLNQTLPVAGQGDQLLALAGKVRDMLDADAKELRFELEDDNSDLAKDLQGGEQNLRDAEELVTKLETYIEQARQTATPDQDAVAKKIDKLDGFASGDGREELQGQLEILFARLSNQPAPRKDELDNKTVFDLVYQAASDLTQDPLQKTDPQFAAAALAELAREGRTLGSLMDDDLGEEAKRLVQALAVLPRGMEVLKRIIPVDDIGDVAQYDIAVMAQPQAQGQDTGKGKGVDTEGTAQTEEQGRINARERNLALYTYLRAGNESSKLERYGMLNPSSQELLTVARGAARKKYEDPGVKLSDAELAAYNAVLNRLTYTGPGSPVRDINDRIKKFSDVWIPLALEREDKLTGRMGQGSHTGAGKIKNVSPKTGKTPLASKTLALADRTATGYAASEFAISGERLDGGVMKTGKDLRNAVVALLRNGVAGDKGIEQLLISVAAGDVARDKLKEKTENGAEPRPEHCIVGGQISRQEILDAVNGAVKKAFAASKLQGGTDRTEAITAAIADSVATAMLKGSPTTEELVETAIKAANETMWYIDGLPKAKSAFLNNLDIAGAMNAIAKANAPQDIEAVKEKLLQLKEEAGLAADAPEAALIDLIADGLEYPLPERAWMPLKAENLIECNKDLKKWVADTELDEQIAVLVEEAALGAQKLAHFIDNSPAPELKSKDDLYNWLVARIEQLEIPGRMRLMSGGADGFSTKGISDTISSTRWAAGIFGGSPKLRLEKLAGRNAAVELIFSSIAMELWIVSEKKTSHAFGFGFGGSGRIPFAGRAGGSADKAWTWDNTDHEGVKLTIPRSRTGEYSEAEMREEMKKLLHTLVYWEPPKNDNDTTEADETSDEVSGLPPLLAAVLAGCTHASVNALDMMSDKYRKQESSFSGWVSGRGNLGDNRAAGGTWNFGGKNVRLDSREYNISEKSGRVNTERHNVAYGGQKAAFTTLGPTSTVATLGTDVMHGIGASLPGGSASRQVSVAGADVKLRLAVREGKTDPSYTRREFEHTTPETLRKNIEANYEAWVENGAKLLFLKPEDKDIPIEEKREYAKRSIEAALKECEKAVRGPNGGKNLRHVFAETYCMTDGAASQLDGFRSKEALVDARIEKLEQHIKGLNKGAPGLKEARAALKEARAEKAKLTAAQTAIYREDSSWMPWKISATERTFESDQIGTDLLFRTGATDVVETQRPVFFWPY